MTHEQPHPQYLSISVMCKLCNSLQPLRNHLFACTVYCGYGCSRLPRRGRQMRSSLPDPDQVKPDTPLRLDVAAADPVNAEGRLDRALAVLEAWGLLRGQASITQPVCQ